MLEREYGVVGYTIKADSQLFHQYNMYQFHGYQDLLEELPGFGQAIKEVKRK